MDPSTEIIVDTPFFRVYKDRRVVRLVGTRTVPPGLDATTGVTSKDVVIDGDSGVYVRLYLPDTGTRPNDSEKLPVLVYFHDGGFVTHSAASPTYQRFLNSLAARAGLLVVSVNYRLAPEHPLPVGYEDSFRALKWVVSGGGGDPWLSQHGDLGRVFLAGDSSGGGIVHNVAMMAGQQGAGLDDVAARIEGAVLLHGVGGTDPVDGETPESVAQMEKLWLVVCPEASDGADDPRTNPWAAVSRSLRDLPCKRVLVCAAEVDFLRPRCRAYYEGLAASGWGGTVEWFESEGQEHVFFLREPRGGAAVALMGRLGRVERLFGTDTTPPGFDADSRVTSKDVVIDSATDVSARLYIPDDLPATEHKKLPVLVYFHGGGLVVDSAASPMYHRYINSVVSKANVLAVSVNYRLAPEHPVPAAYDDSCTALVWAASGADPWLSENGDTSRIFLAGDSGGANIVHNIVIMAGSRHGLPSGVLIEGAILLHPMFGGKEQIDGEARESREIMEKHWPLVCPHGTECLDDPRLNPMADGAPNLRTLACRKLLVCSAEKDHHARPRAAAYFQAGWFGSLEWLESKGEERVFFLRKPECDESLALVNRVVAFLSSN
ncbi:hypothetical protein EJB05_43352, partial [Eragrostis curvula]